MDAAHCTLQSGYWTKKGKYHWHNTTGDVVFTTTARRSSDCVSVCLDNSECLMSGYSPITNVCHGFRFLQDSPTSILQKSEVIYKYKESCTRAGYVLLEGGPLCVKKYNDLLTWDEAQGQCEDTYGRLVVIDDIYKYDTLNQYLAEHFPNDQMWLGINDKMIEGTWVWLNGNLLNYSYWEYHQLNDYSSSYLPERFSADCAFTHDGSLVDDHCLLSKAYICERADLV
ncbi:C-type lectin 1-like [Argopecten irradians]|uniref:C-type lectin 1-like n=1 Tax=Argopecten irradians TaxID=31199 RepID=UPI003712F534